MAKTQKDKDVKDTAAETQAEAPVEDRIDEFAIGQFEAMGQTGRLPDSTAALYKEFKLRHDRLNPRRLSAEGFACVSVLADIISGRLILPTE